MYIARSVVLCSKISYILHSSIVVIHTTKYCNTVHSKITKRSRFLIPTIHAKVNDKVDDRVFYTKHSNVKVVNNVTTIKLKLTMNTICFSTSYV